MEILKPNSHYKHYISGNAVIMPSTAAQAKWMIQKGFKLGLLNEEDANFIVGYMGSFGFKARFTPSKSGRWVRLQNHNDLYKCFKAKFKI